MDDTTTRVCTMCVLCLREDYGYSNYTVEGTTLDCLAGLNDALTGEEEPYGEPTRWREDDRERLLPILDVAKSCPRFREGAPATLDVDHEGVRSYEYIGGKYTRVEVTAESIIAANYTDDDEAAQLLANRFNV